MMMRYVYVIVNVFLLVMKGDDSGNFVVVVFLLDDGLWLLDVVM